MRIPTALLALGIGALHAAPGNIPLPDGLKSVQVNGYNIVYQEDGSGVPIVLIHGSLNDYRVWYSQFPALARRFRVIAPSLRHYYPEKWDGRGDDFSVKQHASDVAALIRKLNLGKVHLLGHSRGGAVVLTVAKEHPDMILSLILADGSGLEALLPLTANTASMASEGEKLRETLARNLAAGNLEAAGQAYADALGGPGSWAKRTPEMKQVFLDNVATALKAEDRKPVVTCEDIAKFKFPILLLNGERSPKRYAEMFAAMQKCVAVAPPVIIPKAAHSMNRENPDAFNSALLGFLSTQ